MLSLPEAPVAFLSEKLGWSGNAVTIVTTVTLGGFGSLAALSGSLLANFKPFGMTKLDLYERTASNTLPLLEGLSICLLTGWRRARSETVAALSNDGMLHNEQWCA